MQTILVPISDRRVGPIEISVDGSYKFDYDFMRAPAVTWGAGERGLARALALVLSSERPLRLVDPASIRQELDDLRARSARAQGNLDQAREYVNGLELLGFTVSVRTARRTIAEIETELGAITQREDLLEAKVARQERAVEMAAERSEWMRHLIKTVVSKEFDPVTTPVPGEFQKAARSLIPDNRPVTYSQWVFAALEMLGKEDPFFGVRRIYREESRR